MSENNEHKGWSPYPLGGNDHVLEYVDAFSTPTPSEMYKRICEHPSNKVLLDARRASGARAEMPSFAPTDYLFRPGDVVTLPPSSKEGTCVSVEGETSCTGRRAKEMTVKIVLRAFANTPRFRHIQTQERPTADAPAPALPDGEFRFTASRSTTPHRIARMERTLKALKGESPGQGPAEEEFSSGKEFEFKFQAPGKVYLEVKLGTKKLPWPEGHLARELNLYEPGEAEVCVVYELRNGFPVVYAFYGPDTRGNFLPPRVTKVEPYLRGFEVECFLAPTRGVWAWLSARREVWGGVEEFGHPPSFEKREDEVYKWTDANQIALAAKEKKVPWKRVQEYYDITKFKPDEWCGMFHGYNNMNAGFDMNSLTRRTVGNPGAKNARMTIFASTQRLLVYWGARVVTSHRDFFGQVPLAPPASRGHRPFLHFPTKAELWRQWRALAADGKSPSVSEEKRKKYGEAASAESYGKLVRTDAHQRLFGEWLDETIRGWLSNEFKAWMPQPGDILIVNASYYKVGGRGGSVELLHDQKMQKIASHVAMVGDYDADTFTLTTYEGNHSRRGGVWTWNLAGNWDGSQKRYDEKVVDTGVFQFFCVGRFVEDDYDRDPGSKRRPASDGTKPDEKVFYHEKSKQGFEDPDRSQLEAAIKLDLASITERGSTFEPTSTK